MKTSVVICTRNRPEEIKAFISSLYQQIEQSSELIIVDSSDQPMNEEVEFNALINREDIEVLYLHTAPGLAKQRNEGVLAATGDIIYFFDDDVILHEHDYLRKMNRIYREHTEYTGGMGTIDNLPKNLRRLLWNLFCKIFLLNSIYGNGKVFLSGYGSFPHGRNHDFMDTEILIGMLQSYRREVFDEFWFDEKLWGQKVWMEDIDFSYRVSRKYRLFFYPDAKLEHYHTVNDSRERRMQFLYNHRYFFFKNFYSRNRLYLIPHWWSILGLFVQSILNIDIDYICSKIKSYYLMV